MCCRQLLGWELCVNTCFSKDGANKGSTVSQESKASTWSTASWASNGSTVRQKIEAAMHVGEKGLLEKMKRARANLWHCLHAGDNSLTKVPVTMKVCVESNESWVTYGSTASWESTASRIARWSWIYCWCQEDCEQAPWTENQLWYLILIPESVGVKTAELGYDRPSLE